MVGLLNALPRTRLYERLEKEQRLLKETTGDNTDFSINFVPKMNYDLLISGYKKVVTTLYSPKNYYERVRTFLMEYMAPQKKMFQFRLNHLAALFRSMVVLGIMGKERFHYWSLLLWTIFSRPRLIPQAVTLSIYGFHFRKVFEKRLS